MKICDRCGMQHPKGINLTCWHCGGLLKPEPEDGKIIELCASCGAELPDSGPGKTRIMGKSFCESCADDLG